MHWCSREISTDRFDNLSSPHHSQKNDFYNKTDYDNGNETDNDNGNDYDYGNDNDNDNDNDKSRDCGWAGI